MLKTEAPVDGAMIREAIEARDGRRLAGFYGDDAELTVIDRNNPPSRPRRVKGRAEIATFWDDVCGRAILPPSSSTAAMQ